MGHELSVHKKFYRLQDDVIELAKISRLLIAVEEGKAAHFTGCTLDDINVADIPEEDVPPDGDEDDEDIRVNDTDVSDAEVGVEEIDEIDDAQNPAFNGDQDENDTREMPRQTNNRSGQTKCSKKRWTLEEKDALAALVSKSALEKKPPRKNDILSVQAKNPVLKSLNFLSIKYQVWALAQQKQAAERKLIQNLGLHS